MPIISTSLGAEFTEAATHSRIENIDDDPAVGTLLAYFSNMESDWITGNQKFLTM